jgi:hypothetical protein
MKKTIIILVIALSAMHVSAQNESKKHSFGFGIEAGSPQGSFANIYNFDAGLTLRYSIHTGPGFITLTTGAVAFAPKTVVGISEKAGLQIPFRAGYKYIIQHHFFVLGEIGYVSNTTYFSSQGKVVSTSAGSFLAAPSAGVQFNAFELSLRYESYSGQGSGNVGLRLGFNF